MLGVGQDVAVVAGVLTAFSCSLVFKEEFSLLSSSFSAAGVTASVTSTASNPSLAHIESNLKCCCLLLQKKFCFAAAIYRMMSTWSKLKRQVDLLVIFD